MSGPGHNRGPTMERGAGWRRFAWRRARADLLPVLPVEVVRMRVRRARELGLEYRTYAGVRAATGRDLVAFLFSSNALRVDRDGRLDASRAERLEALRHCGRIALVHPPVSPERVVALNPVVEKAGRAPGLADRWGTVRARVLDTLGPLPRDGVLVIGEAPLEREWSEAGRLAGYLPADRFFGT